MIDRVDLIRIEQGGAGTFGVLRVDGHAWCVTLEPPDLGNAANVSCIPSGSYICRKVESPRFGKTFEVVDVPGRSNILLHPGNVVDDTQGCVLLGRQFGLLRGDRGVLNSGRAFREFMDHFRDVEEFSFSVQDGLREAA